MGNEVPPKFDFGGILCLKTCSIYNVTYLYFSIIHLLTSIPINYTNTSFTHSL